MKTDLKRGHHSKLSDYQFKAEELVAQMTLEEKASLCSGAGFWTTKPVERLHIPAIFMTDGPHGLRKDATGVISNSNPATCFPTASALASSYDTELMENIGVALAEECLANDVQILLDLFFNLDLEPNTVMETPLRTMVTLSCNNFSEEQLEELLVLVNRIKGMLCSQKSA